VHSKVCKSNGKQASIERKMDIFQRLNQQ
jgi:hypothetical protein